MYEKINYTALVDIVVVSTLCVIYFKNLITAGPVVTRSKMCSDSEFLLSCWHALTDFIIQPDISKRVLEINSKTI